MGQAASPTLRGGDGGSVQQLLVPVPVSAV